MVSRWLPGCVFCVVFVLLSSASSFAKETKNCIGPGDAQSRLEKDVCVSMHVYDVVQLRDGTRFLDVCAPEISDEQCRFTVISRWQDVDMVGPLEAYRGTDVSLRGVVSLTGGRYTMELSHNRQFHGGPPRFRPNPILLHGFGGSQAQPAVSDPNVRVQGRARSFMNWHYQVPLKK